MLTVNGILANDTDPMVGAMNVDKAPLESYGSIGGLENQTQETRESVKLLSTHQGLYEETGVKPFKSILLFVGPGASRTLLSKAVASSTSASFLRAVGCELIQMYLVDGPKLL